MKENADFFNLYSHGFIRVAVGTPEVRVADPAFNAARTIELMAKAEREKALLALFPELGLTSYSCEDLFQLRRRSSARQDTRDCSQDVPAQLSRVL